MRRWATRVASAVAVGGVTVAASLSPNHAVASGASPWPGSGLAVATGSGNRLGPNISGLVFASTGRLWAVRDFPSMLLRLDRKKSGWAASTGAWVNGSGLRYPDGTGVALRYPDGSGVPDAEAVTTGGGSSALFVAAERDHRSPNTARNSVLRFAVDSAVDGQLVADREWNIDAVVAPRGANTGVEGLTWVPDSELVAAGLIAADGRPYDPARFPEHGRGLFLVGAEGDGLIHAVALPAIGEPTVVATWPSGLPVVTDLTWHAGRHELWALCDDHCGPEMAVFDTRSSITAGSRRIAVPSGLRGLNLEGLALAPECVGGRIAVVWSDDGADDEMSLSEASLPCRAVSSANVSWKSGSTGSRAVRSSP